MSHVAITRIHMAVATALLCCAANAQAIDAKRVAVNIQPQPVIGALKELGEQTGLQLLMRVDGASSNAIVVEPVTGELSLKAALDKLLAGTGLTYEFVNDRTVRIVRPASKPLSSLGTADTFRLAEVAELTERADTGGAGGGRARASEERGGQSRNAQSSEGVPEVIVSAEKRSERLQDVPVPVAAVQGESLVENNQPRLRDYFGSVPGLSVSPTGAASGGQQVLAIRGISSGNFGNPTVGVTVDDVPYGAFTREFAPDIDPSDLARIEVLRGPQGTLYGASSMGGLLKFVTVDPSTERVFGRAQADVFGVQNGAQTGYSLRGAVNVPLSETWAARVSGFTRRDPGYIDNPVLGIDGVNESRVSGGRVSALWRPSDALSLKLSALYQHTRGDGASDVDLVPGLGDLEQNYVRGTGAYEQEVQAYSAILTARLGEVELTSLTGYNINEASNSSDFSFTFAPSAQRLFGVSGASVYTDTKTDKFSQEIRAAIPLGEKIEWLIGGFYTHEDIPFAQNVFAQEPSSGNVAGVLQFLSIPIKHTEYAAFTNFKLQLTQRFDIQLGARESRLDENFEPVTQGGALIGATQVLPAIESDANVFTYLLTPRFKVSPDMMLYARIASGYRPGRSNSFNPDTLVPRASDPDRTKTYELGAKGDVLGALLTYDASLFYIDWKDVQITLVDPRNNLSYFTNGSRAKSQGVELSLESRPLTGLRLAAWGTYTDAVLTEPFPPGSPAFGPDGSRLPFGARVSANLSVDQDFPVGSRLTAFVGATASYLGDRIGIFVATPARAVYPSYTKIDLRTGVRLEDWTVNLYANNVADKRGVIGGGAGTFPPYAINYIQPRTVGLSVVRSF
jgi:outer membrane receptor protein involved in Fe transport